MPTSLPLTPHQRFKDFQRLGFEIYRPSVNDGRIVVTLAKPRRTLETTGVTIQIDTGADISLISPELLRRMKVRPCDCVGCNISTDAGARRLIYLNVSSLNLGLRSFSILATELVSLDKEPTLMIGLADMRKMFRSIQVDWTKMRWITQIQATAKS